ncbi:hypothetical protein QBC46DRAFT_435499 [Diplogelasinospora grovesii]|uniref:Uncharacterized protein n=1 Tax=Diplogelasinospora grovesii TaxID=303347 RepID=A0AAN6S526_9PEZI|nr:hypothetical protein QBC46DRAFT_435499 [Diplogelasinospora grovesii]
MSEGGVTTCLTATVTLPLIVRRAVTFEVVQYLLAAETVAIGDLSSIFDLVGGGSNGRAAVMRHIGIVSGDDGALKISNYQHFPNKLQRRDQTGAKAIRYVKISVSAQGASVDDMMIKSDVQYCNPSNMFRSDTAGRPNVMKVVGAKAGPVAILGNRKKLHYSHPNDVDAEKEDYAKERYASPVPSVYSKACQTEEKGSMR